MVISVEAMSLAEPPLVILHIENIQLVKHSAGDATPKHCSIGQGRIAFSLFSAALQNRLTAGTGSLQIHLCTFALHTVLQ